MNRNDILNKLKTFDFLEDKTDAQIQKKFQKYTNSDLIKMIKEWEEENIFSGIETEESRIKNIQNLADPILDDIVYWTDSSYFGNLEDLNIESHYGSFKVMAKQFNVFCKLIQIGILASPDYFNFFKGEQMDVGYKLEPIYILENKNLCVTFLKMCRDQHVQISPIIDNLYLFEGRIVAMPWQIHSYTAFSDSETRYGDDNSAFWSSLQKDKCKSLDSLIFPYIMKSEVKTKHSIFYSDITNIASYIKLSDYSYDKMYSYVNDNEYINRISLAGDNQVWKSERLIFKLIRDYNLWIHEINVYNKKLLILPQMIDYWEHEDEYFIVIEKRGLSILNLYYLECLIPNNIKLQMAQVIQELKDNGIAFMDSHYGNFVVDQDIVYAIDAESMLFIDDIKITNYLIKTGVFNLAKIKRYSKTRETDGFYIYLYNLYREDNAII